MTLQILHGNKVLGKFCGRENSADGNHPGSQPILTSGNTLTLVFQSDQSNTDHRNIGFSVHYQAIGNIFICQLLFSALLQHWTTLFNSLLTRHRRVFCSRTWRCSSLFPDLPQHPWLIHLLLSPRLWAPLRRAHVCVWVCFLCWYALKY